MTGTAEARVSTGRSQRIELAEVASRADLPAIMAADGIDVRRGMAFCPFHENRRTPALSVFRAADRWRFRCHSCDAAGDAVEYVMLYDGVEAIEAARIIDPTLARPADWKPTRTMPRAIRPGSDRSASGDNRPDWRGVSWQREIEALIAEAAATLWSPAGRLALDWLRARGLDDVTIARFRLGHIEEPGRTGPVDRPNGVAVGVHYEAGIVLPWLAPGGSYDPAVTIAGPRWCGVNIRRLAPDGDKCRAIYGSERGFAYPWPDLDATQGNPPALVVEGEFDALLGQQLLGHLAYVVSVGGAESEPQASALSALGSCPKWLIALDRDDAGNAGAIKWIDRCPRKSIRVLVPGAIDLTDSHLAGTDLHGWLEGELNRIGKPAIVRPVRQQCIISEKVSGPAWLVELAGWPSARQAEWSTRTANALRVASILGRELTGSEAERDTFDQMRAESDHAASVRRAPAPAPARPELGGGSWSEDGRTWTAAGASGLAFDEPSMARRPARADRPEDAPRPYAGRARKGPDPEAVPVDAKASALAEVESWAAVGRSFMESAPNGKTPEHQACLYRLGAGMFARARKEARAAKLDDQVVAGLAAEEAEATRRAG